MPYTPHSKEEQKILSWKMLHLAGRQLHHFTNENVKGLYRTGETRMVPQLRSSCNQRLMDKTKCSSCENSTGK